MPNSATATPLAAIDVSRAELWREWAVAPLFARLRREEPVHHCPQSAFGAYWSVTRYQDIVEVESQPDLFSSDYARGGSTLAGTGPSAFPMFMDLDGPEHGPQRQTVAPAFNPSELQRLRPAMLERTKQLIASLPIGETFDWAERVSVELSCKMLAILLGFPCEESRKLAHWSDWASDFGVITTPELRRKRLEILWECAGAFLNLQRQRQERPTGDLISMMTHSEATKRLTPQEFLGNLILLIVGGNDTTRSAMSALPAVNALWPEEWDKLRVEPALIPTAAQELIRWQTPLAHMRRTAISECELAGRTIRAGEKLALWYFSANRDEELFDDGERFLSDRPNARRHLAFGHGIHRCVGARLAELQLTTLLEVLLERGLKPVRKGNSERTASCFANGYRTMPTALERG